MYIKYWALIRLLSIEYTCFHQNVSFSSDFLFFFSIFFFPQQLHCSTFFPLLLTQFRYFVILYSLLAFCLIRLKSIFSSIPACNFELARSLNTNLDSFSVADSKYFYLLWLQLPQFPCYYLKIKIAYSSYHIVLATIVQFLSDDKTIML